MRKVKPRRRKRRRTVGAFPEARLGFILHLEYSGGFLRGEVVCYKARGRL